MLFVSMKCVLWFIALAVRTRRANRLRWKVRLTSSQHHIQLNHFWKTTPPFVFSPPNTKCLQLNELELRLWCDSNFFLSKINRSIPFVGVLVHILVHTFEHNDKISLQTLIVIAKYLEKKDIIEYWVKCCRHSVHVRRWMPKRADKKGK